MAGSVRDRVVEVLVKLAPNAEIDVDSTLSEIGIDINGYDELVVELESEFDIDPSDFENEISESEFEDATVQDVIDAIKRIQ